jgi:LAO/AO transport system kinase
MDEGADRRTLSAADSELVERLLARERRALAKVVTLIESSRDDHRLRGQGILEKLLAHAGNSVRIGISGVPGAGKSTFIEALGLYLLERGRRVAVLAVDPSSAVSGGSVLGDKTRMERLAREPGAFIRPSPTRGLLGGVAARTRETIFVCEAAGFDVVVVETVGVGQSEAAVAGMVDVFALLQLPGAGDELQAIKRGALEFADIIAYNKADLWPDAVARARLQMAAALAVLAGSNCSPASVIEMSALRRDDVSSFWQEVERRHHALVDCGEFSEKRKRQSLIWMWALIEGGLRQNFRGHPAVQRALPGLTRALERGETTPTAAAGRLLNLVYEAVAR